MANCSNEGTLKAADAPMAAARVMDAESFIVTGTGFGAVVAELCVLLHCGSGRDEHLLYLVDVDGMRYHPRPWTLVPMGSDEGSTHSARRRGIAPTDQVEPDEFLQTSASVVTMSCRPGLGQELEWKGPKVLGPQQLEKCPKLLGPRQCPGLSLARNRTGISWSSSPLPEAWPSMPSRSLTTYT
jgi:hypothetical protein